LEATERTDRALSRTFGSQYRLNEQVVGVAFTFVDPFVATMALSALQH